MEFEYIFGNSFIAKIYFPINAGSNPVKDANDLNALLNTKQIISVYKNGTEAASLFGTFDYIDSYLYIEGVDHGVKLTNASCISIEFEHTNDDTILTNKIRSILIAE